jgi:hypothetical protein
MRLGERAGSKPSKPMRDIFGDALMSSGEGLSKGVALLQDARIAKPAGEMYWA